MDTASSPPLPIPFKPLPFSSKPSARIFVGNIAPFLGLQDLRNYFSRYGKVIDVYAPKATLVGGVLKHKGYAFVEFETPETALQVRKEAERYSNNNDQEDNPFILGSRPLIIDRADPRAAPPLPASNTTTSVTTNRSGNTFPSLSIPTTTVPDSNPPFPNASKLSLSAASFPYAGTNRTIFQSSPPIGSMYPSTLESNPRSIYSSHPTTYNGNRSYVTVQQPPSTYSASSTNNFSNPNETFRSYGSGTYLRNSGNITTTTVEGTAWNMQTLRNAIPSEPNPLGNRLTNPSFPYLSSSSNSSTVSGNEPSESIEIDKPFELNILRTIASPTETEQNNFNFPMDGKPIKSGATAVSSSFNEPFPYTLPNLSLPFLHGTNNLLLPTKSGSSGTNILPGSVNPVSYPETITASSANMTGTVDTPLSWISRSSTPDRLTMVSNILEGLTTSSMFDPTNLTTLPNRPLYDGEGSTSIEDNNGKFSSKKDNFRPTLSSMDIHASSSSSSSTLYGSPIAPLSSASTNSTSVHSLPSLNLHHSIRKTTIQQPAVSPPTERPTTVINELTLLSTASSTVSSPTLSGLSSREGIALERLRGVHWPELTSPFFSTDISIKDQGGSTNSTTIDRLHSIPVSTAVSASSSPVWPPLPPPPPPPLPSNVVVGSSSVPPFISKTVMTPVLTNTIVPSNVNGTNIEDTSLRIFIGKIGTFTNSNSLWAYFLSTLTELGFTEPHRAIEDIYYPSDEHGHPRGFAFVSFTCKTAYEAIVSIPNHVIEGRTVVIDTAVPRGTKVLYPTSTGDHPSK